MLLLPEGQTDEGWDPFIKRCTFRNWGAIDGKSLLLYLVLKGFV
jgi:hypothetical protein